MAQETSGHWRSAIIEVFAVVLLAIFGGLVEKGSVDLSYRRWAIVAGVAILLLLVLRSIDHISRKRAMKVGTVGKIDGIWLDAIYAGTGELLQVSFIEKAYSQAKGFDVRGWSYDIEIASDGSRRIIRPDPGGDHHFEGDCSFYYEGREHKEHKGSGFYRFRRSPDKRLLFDGGFGYWNLEDGKITLARFVQGEKFNGEKKEYSTEEKRIALLERFLKNRSARYTFSRESAAHGAIS